MKLTTFKIILFVFTITSFLTTFGLAQKIDIHGPEGSVEFGREVVALPNGNIVVTDPSYSIPGGAEYIGAVYLYNGATGELISTLTGSNRYNRVGYGGITLLSNGNYVISSQAWSNGESFLSGAVTFANGETGVSGVVSESNSLVGSGELDCVGRRVQALKNGNYVVISEDWNDGASAITFGNGTKGIIGKVTASNSLVGSVESNQDKKISAPKLRLD